MAVHLVTALHRVARAVNGFAILNDERFLVLRAQTIAALGGVG